MGVLAAVLTLVTATGCTNLGTSGALKEEPLVKAGKSIHFVEPDQELRFTIGDYDIQVPQGATQHRMPLYATTGPGLGRVVKNLSTTWQLTLELGRGGRAQPRRPVRITQELQKPVPNGSEVTVLRSQGLEQTPVVLKTMLSRDRKTVTFNTAHFTDFYTVIGNASEIVGGILTTRGETPKCEHQAPKWVLAADFINQAGDPPVRVCVGADPEDAEIAVVKVTNNRGTGLIYTPSTAPAWAWTGAPGLVKATVSDWLSRASDAQRDRSYYLMPGQQLHLGFARDSTDSSLRIDLEGTTSTSAVVYGLVWASLDDLHLPSNLRTAVAGTMMSICVADSIGDPLSRAGAVQAWSAFVDVLQCGIGQYDDIIRATRRALTADSWAKVSPTLYRTSGAFLRHAHAYLALATAAHRTMEMAADLAQDPAARRIVLHTAPVQPSQRLIDYGGSMHLGVVIASPADVRLLSGAPHAFRAFMADTIGFLQAQAEAERAGCGPLVTITVHQLRTDGFARATTASPNDDGQGCYPYGQAVYVKQDGQWRTLEESNDGFPCDILEKANVPSSIMGGSSARCVGRNFESLPYNHP